MARMLGSAASREEAEILWSSAVDVIDIKDPRDGALGRVPTEVCQEIVSWVAGRCRTSATVGDVTAYGEELTGRIQETAATGVDYVKVGLFGDQLPKEFLDSLRDCRGTPVVVVLFAEHYPRLRTRLQDLMDAGIRGLMIDTCDKGNTLTGLLEPPVLEDFLRQTRASERIAGLAGSLRLSDLRHPVLHLADYLGFRGALCRDGQRHAMIDPVKVRDIRARVRAGHSDSPHDLRT